MHLPTVPLAGPSIEPWAENTGVKLLFRDAEIVGQDMARRLRQPLRQRAFMIGAAVQHADDLGVFRADVLDRVSAIAGDVSTLARRQFGDRDALVRRKQRNPRSSLQHIMPFIGIGMPMRIMHRAALQLEDHPGHGRRDRKLLRRCDVERASGRTDSRLLGHQRIAMTSPTVEFAGRTGLRTIQRQQS